jgi:hypothetical protein
MAKDSVVLVVARWVARGWSILSILFVLIFAIGGVGSIPRPTVQEWCGLALWPIGVGVGLIAAWYREEFGGAFAVACLAAFYIWNMLCYRQMPRGPFFLLVAAPGILFVATGLLSHHRVPREI